ncbi:MAG: methionyl-tRNA formyltransferase [Christensenellaceae bacterium]|nr:methionyl-tRNA formyltransferase [Christensenellaceae bacterium]
MKIAFFGTPEFCLPTLRALHESKHKVVCVVTQPDRPSGRSKEPTAPPAKKLALELEIPVFQPERISKHIDYCTNEPDPLCETLATADIIITCAFGQILKQNVIDYCKFGVVNVHASLLPKYRGACPINFAIINGEKWTGVTIMQTDIGIDTGDILTQTPYIIGEDETAGELSSRLAEIGATALLKTLDQIEKGTVIHTPQATLIQKGTPASYFPMLKKTDGKIDLTKPSREIVNFVRGMNPWPMAYVESNLGDIRVYSAHVFDGAVQFDIIQAPGGKPMKYKDFLNGHKDFKLK